MNKREQGCQPADQSRPEDLDANDVLAAVDDALDEHARWLNRWHRALVCRIEPEPDLLDEDRVLYSRFGMWYLAHADDPLLRQSAVSELWKSYRSLHELARLLAERARADRPVPVGEYDELVARADAFRGRARRLRDAFGKAVSTLDPLTGLSTRAGMMAEVETAYRRGTDTGHGGKGLAIGLCDIDHFKAINDAHGHGVGDEVLRAVAGRFVSRLRPTDTIYRYGGEEFLVCLPNAGEETARDVLERLRRALEERPIGLDKGGAIEVRASFGLAVADRAAPLKTVIERADEALYRSKDTGRNRITCWRPGLSSDLSPEFSKEGGRSMR
ncbi:diguanylate cyclase [Marivibrio halodurans]|uniref:diguanylate cyclase n=1 Tax=Marivibrio halodurans TaxID=2039722 RepID=A0A8J7S3J7_9PROT|nr:diguanylate cyclase [Marivibrio halodurans]MBP5856044.1 diguanylate cyclase [Marivibrio halodurans]